nr:protein PFC0760c [Crassostrea gigas]
MKTCLFLLAQIVVHVLSKESPNATCGEGRCCVNFYKDKFNGFCVECPLGTHGVNCTGICPPQYYGQLCKSLCNCSIFQFCNNKYGCLENETKNGNDNIWKYVAFTLIGSIFTMVVVGLVMLMRSLLAKRCSLWREIHESNENETGNPEEEHRYERRRSLPSTEGVENEQPRGQAEENNYTDLRRSALFPIYDNPDERMPCPNSNTAPADAAKSLALWDLSIDGEDDSSDEEESEDEGYGQLFKHEMYNVLSLRRTYPDKSIHVRPFSNDAMLNTSSNETPDGYQSIQLATSKVPEEASKKLSRSLCEKATIRQSLISETIEEYIQTSKVTRNLDVHEDEVEQPCMVITGSNSEIQSTGIDQPSKKNTRPYSLAKTSWSSDLTQDKITIAESIDEDDNENEYDDVDNKDDDVNKKGDENEYDDVNKEDNMNQDRDADKDDVINDNDGNEDDVYEKSRPITQSNMGNETSKGNDIIQKSCREAECENQPEKTTKNEEFPEVSLTDSPDDNSPNQEYTQVIKKRMLSSTENKISEKNPAEVDPLLSKKTIGFSSDEKVLSELSGSSLVATDEGNLKSSADKDTSENDISDITYRLINITTNF